MELQGNILITGGAGTLGQAIVERARRDEWDCNITIYSRDPLKHQAMRRKYPECRYVLGDILDLWALTLAMAGHDMVIHAAAQKHIPEAERHTIQCYHINVTGSMNVLDAAVAAGVAQVIGIGTDKGCHAVNVYGASKFMMERMYQEFAQSEAAEAASLRIVLCRYGNVLASNGSVIQVWRDALKRGEKPKITDPAMTRFWLSEQQAVDLILYTQLQPAATVTVPRLPALSMARMAEYAGVREYDVIGLRPGEKMHEMLVTPQEWPFIDNQRSAYMTLYPVTGKPRAGSAERGYTSDTARDIGEVELRALLEEAMQ